MPFELELAATLRLAGWKVKIHDLEDGDEPHVTIYKKHETAWRFGLQSLQFLDDGRTWGQIHKRVGRAIEVNLDLLRAEWNRMHPHNSIDEWEA
ncbi:MAG: hypothetical protein AB7U73_09030 [Pirellulales bacterium]